VRALDRTVIEKYVDPLDANLERNLNFIYDYLNWDKTEGVS